MHGRVNWDISDQRPLQATGSSSSAPSLHVGARSPPLCPQVAGWSPKGWNRLSNKGWEKNWYRMDTEPLGWGRVWRPMGGDRWKQKLLERVLSAEKEMVCMTPRNTPLTAYTHSHTLYFFKRANPCASTAITCCFWPEFHWRTWQFHPQVRNSALHPLKVFSEFLLLGTGKETPF